MSIDVRRPLPRRLARLLAATGLLLIGLASPAAADPAGPTHYDSGLSSVEPADAPIDVRILGGDAFLVLSVPAGVEAEVPGYEGEPYIRFEADGTVLVNERSPARWLNDARYGELDMNLPTIADADAEPVFTEVASGGTYAWHDHRIHFMSPSLPAQVDPSAGTPQPVMDWSVPVQVDGEAVEITGQLVWLPGPSALVTTLLVALAVALAAAVVVRRPGAAPVLTVVGVVVAAGIGLTKVIGLPPGSDLEPMLVGLPGIAVALLLLGYALSRRSAGGDARAAVITAAAGIPLLVWSVLQIGSLSRPIVPGPLPVGAVRVAVALTGAAGLAALGAVVRQVLSATSLDEPERRSVA